MSQEPGNQPYPYGAPQPRELPPGQPPYQPPPPPPPQQQWHQPPPPPAQQASPPAQAPVQDPPQQVSPTAQQAPPPSPAQAPVQEPPQQVPPTAQQVRPPEGAPQPGWPQLRPITVEEIVETEVVTVQRDTPLQTVAAEMAEQDVGSVVVVEDDVPVGVLTDRAITLSLQATPDVSDRKAEDLVSGSLVTGTMEMSVFEAIRQLEEATIRRLPIVDEEGELAGIVTLDDILVLLGAELDNVCSIIQAQSPRL